MSQSHHEWWAPERPAASTPAAPAAPPRRSRNRGRQERARRTRRRRTAWVVVIVLAVVAGAGYLVVSSLGDMFSGGKPTASPSDFPGPGTGEVEITVNPGDSGAAIGQTLQEAGVVASVSAFVSAYDADEAALGIQPGTYRLLLEMPAADAVAALLNPASRVQSGVVVAEGLTVEQILKRISEESDIPLKDLRAAAGQPDKIGLPEQAGGELEGWLFPATYDVGPDDSAVKVLKTMTAKTVQVLEDAGVPKDQWEPVLIKASLVEREAKHDEDRPKMARAIENRLEDGWTLGIDAAVAYGAGVNGTELTTAMLEDASNPYNLRVHAGLPPTPIASPGKVSIDAVLAPAEGDWMYWCAVNLDTGETKFGVTEADHAACVAEMNAWIEENS
ncbi:endolytic transglycosylase MltG [Cellulomonas gilvus]|uniref:Endolytic murein transglycosylase n=1 Tax=Cellulomonas gilvus (strain ATCC 13127 / NRRL B-14078) TaxID=593907 RepID=F8A515_CELGA|nr:endolytic transglycosylase MltG [Cellulomonas gilvus]AEI12118.1 aminodeoxychorismate lyase [Cellulomonas gilvus ATCC 13127]